MGNTRKYFGTDGVRDLANSGNMTAEFALKLGRAFMRFNRGKKIVIGRDTRLSGKMLECALSAGISSEGAEVCLTGIIPTPGVSWAIKNLGADAGAVISASHNPAEYNGIKFLGADGCKLSDSEELEIEHILENPEDMKPDHESIMQTIQTGNIIPAPDLSEKYAEHIAKLAESGLSAKLASKNIAFDCAFGAASVIVPSVLINSGISGHVLSANFNGLDINAGAGVMHMENLTGFVKNNRFDLGFAFDGDADRVLISDSKGRIIDGDIILWVLGRWLKLQKISGSDSVVVTVMSNMALESHLARENIETLRCPVGDRYVLEAMREKNSALGGEQSGHIIAMPFTSTGDGLCTAMLFLNAINDLNENSDTLVDRFGRYPQKLTNLRLRKPRELVDMSKVDEIVEDYKSKIANLDGRIFVRTSGTEPLLRILIEAREADVVENFSLELSNILEKFC